MTLISEMRCQVKTSFFGCRNMAIGMCQYCTRTFCSEHGVQLEEWQEVCVRKNCAAKREDITRHQVYKASVGARNEARACGVEGCSASLMAQCRRCQGLFCGGHIKARTDIFLENDVRVKQLVNLCEHCWSRRPLWQKT